MKIFSPILFHFALLLTIFSGCNNKCDEFNNDIITWMPYQEGDTIIVSNNGNYDTFLVTFSEVFHIDKLRIGTNCNCMENYQISLSSDSIHIEINFDNSRNVANSDFLINDERLLYSEKFDKLTINGKEYTDVIEYKNNEDIYTCEFLNVYISKSIGIISISRRKGIWNILDDSKKTINVSEINIFRTDC